MANIGNTEKQDALLRRLCEKGHLTKALDAVSHIHISLSTDTYLCLLKSCITQKSLFHVKQVHAHIARHHINLCGLLGDYLVTAFSRCGSIKDALQLSHTLPSLSAHSWAAIISACADSVNGLEALELHQRMQQDGVSPNSYIFVALFKACGNIHELEYGRHLHAYACSEGLGTNIFVGNTLVSMYGKCGAVVDAENVFLALSQRDLISWSAMLSAYVQQGEERKTLYLFRQMLEDGLLPNQHALVFSLQACIAIAEKDEGIVVERRKVNFALLEIGRALHAHSHARGFQSDLFLETTILTLYGRCGALEEAINVFLAKRLYDLVAWTAILSVLLEQVEGEKVLWLYGVMQEEGLKPNESVFVAALQACCILVKRKQASTTPKMIPFQIGQALHTDACKYDCVLNNHVGTALVSMYSACGALAEAEQVFGMMLYRDMVAWNAMLSAFVEQGLGDRALCLFRQMQVEGVGSNQSTFVLVLQACGVILESSTDWGTLSKLMCMKTFQALHMDACKKGYTSNGIVGNALLCLYGKYGTIAEAEVVFDSLYEHDIATWTAMLLAYIEQDEDEKALWIHEKMLKEDAWLDEVAVICILDAGKEMGTLEVCQRRHFDIVSAGLEVCPAVALAIMDAYGCCSRVEDADAVFHGQCTPNILLWTTCISSHAGGGRDCMASFCVYEKLTLEDFSPDELTLTSVLSACCHAGLIIQGLEYFYSMSKEYHLAAEPFHYSIIFDSLGRAGDLWRIENMIGSVPFLRDPISWLCLLGACSSHGDMELAEQAFNHAIDLQPMQGSAFIIMSNIYANGG